MRCALVLAVLLLAACGRAPRPGEPTDYKASDGSFSARLPSDWKVDESRGETRKAAFYGPPAGDKPLSQLMGVYFHAAADPAAARFYLSSAQDGTTPVRDVKVGGLSGFEAVANHSISDVHLGLQKTVKRTVVVAVPGGFYSLEHTWPYGDQASPAFDELLRTFKPAAKAS